MKAGASTTSLVALLLIMFLGVPVLAHAAWSDNPAVNTPISTMGGSDANPAMIGDGAGGAIIAWMGPGYDIYTQKIDPQGNPKWVVNGVVLSSGGAKYYPQLVSDGNGGAIVTWQDGWSGYYIVYAQRVASDGTVPWPAGGVAICPATVNQQYPQIMTDGDGGAIITWQDWRSQGQSKDTGWDIYAQRINAAGQILWKSQGVMVCYLSSHQQYPQLIGDGSGGAIITWQDNRSGDTGWDIYAQRINPAGEIQWTPNGVAVCSQDYHQEYPRLVGDGSGGAIVTWQDWRSASSAQEADIYAQRITAAGQAQWTAQGVAVSTAAHNQWNPQIVTDGSGGAIIAWWDNRGAPADTNWYIYAQRVDSNGAVQWAADGAVISLAAGIDSSNKTPQMISDGSGGAIIAWADNRYGTQNDLYAQRIDSTGALQWTASGAAIATAPNHQQLPSLISDGAGGAIVTWQDVRAGDWNIYAQKILAGETLPCTSLSVRIGETFLYYPTISEAYNVAITGDTLKMKALDLTEMNLVLAKDISVVLQGGYAGCDYLSNPGFTTIRGSLTISLGQVTVENVAIL